MSNQLNLFIDLIRIKKPIGFMLLFWPCAWGLSLAYDFSKGLNLYFFYLTLFLLGAILMRSAGCIVNDIFDREFDSKVSRTKERPIASGRITVKLAVLYSALLCLIALIVLLNFNSITIIFAICSMPLAFSYPLMKRFTYWPQLFLGITFNYGLVLGWLSIEEKISLIMLVFYIGAIFWTLGYDTIYGFQDINDDEIIGLKSTSIKFKNNAKNFLFISYFIFIFLFLMGGYLMNLSKFYFLSMLITAYHLFIYQIKGFNQKSPEICLKTFKSNNFFGLIMLLRILIGKFF